jgi:hypothetical protein
VVNFDVKTIYVYLHDGAVMDIKIAPMERMRRTVLPLLAPTTNLIVQKVGKKVHLNVSRKVNCATEKEIVWTELMNEKLVQRHCVPRLIVNTTVKALWKEVFVRVPRERKLPPIANRV